MHPLQQMHDPRGLKLDAAERIELSNKDFAGLSLTPWVSRNKMLGTPIMQSALVPDFRTPTDAVLPGLASPTWR